MNMRGKTFEVEMYWMDLAGLERKSGMRLWFSLMCLTEKSYLENQSFNLRI